MKKKILAIAMTAIVAALGLTGCNNGMGINDDGTYTWKMALNSTEGDNAYDTGAAFAKKIEELTDGRVEVVLYGGGSLFIQQMVYICQARSHIRSFYRAVDIFSVFLIQLTDQVGLFLQ